VYIRKREGLGDQGLRAGAIGSAVRKELENIGFRM
jgi:hypothetical protein